MYRLMATYVYEICMVFCLIFVDCFLDKYVTNCDLSLQIKTQKKYAHTDEYLVQKFISLTL